MERDKSNRGEPEEPWFRVLPPAEPRTFNGFLDFLLGKLRIESNEAGLELLRRSPRWKFLGKLEEKK